MPNLQIQRLPVGQMNANCYLVSSDDEAIIIDPGDDADYIIQKISDQETVPTQIIATHGHFDHIMAATELKLAYKIPFLIHEKDDFFLSRMRKTAKHFQGIDPGPPPPVDMHLRGGEKIRLGKQEIVIMHTPGHTPGSISIYSKVDKQIIVGDLVFADGSIGRTDHSYSDQRMMIDSLNKIHSLPKGTSVYPGHGEIYSI